MSSKRAPTYCVLWRVCGFGAFTEQRPFIMYMVDQRESTSRSQRAEVASEGMRQSPRGERQTEPTFGPSGRHERLNCWLKKRRKKVRSQWRMVSGV